MVTRARLALFVSGIFFGGGLDHLIYIAAGSTRSHYGLELTPLQHGAFALFDVTVAATLLWLHVRWDRRRGGTPTLST